MPPGPPRVLSSYSLPPPPPAPGPHLPHPQAGAWHLDTVKGFPNLGGLRTTQALGKWNKDPHQRHTHSNPRTCEYYLTWQRGIMGLWVQVAHQLTPRWGEHPELFRYTQGDHRVKRGWQRGMGEKDSVVLLVFRWRKGLQAMGHSTGGKVQDSLPMGPRAHFGGHLADSAPLRGAAVQVHLCTWLRAACDEGSPTCSPGPGYLVTGVLQHPGQCSPRSGWFPVSGLPEV